MSRPAPDKGPVPVAFPFIGDAVGGSHISALNLLRHVDPERFRPEVLVDIGDGPVADLFRKEDVPFAVTSGHGLIDHRNTSPSAHSLDLLRYGAAYVRRLRRHLGQARIPLLHSNDGRMHVFGSIACRLAGARHVWHHRSDPAAFSLRWVSPLGADHLVTVSRFAGPKPGFWSAANKWTIVPSPFPTDMTPPPRSACRQEMITALGVEPEALIVAFFGNLIERKRPFDFVRAIAAFRAEHPSRPITAPIFGEALEIETAAIETFAREQGVGDCVRPMGFRYPPERWLAGADVLFVPAVREPFGRTLIEAMIVGTPVVAVDDGGNPEAIEDGRNGYLVPVADAAAAAARFAGIAADRSAAEMLAARARKDALERFGMQRHADAIMAVYDRLLAGRKAVVGVMARHSESSNSCSNVSI